MPRTVHRIDILFSQQKNPRGTDGLAKGGKPSKKQTEKGSSSCFCIETICGGMEAILGNWQVFSFFGGKSKARQDGRVQPSSSVFSIPLPPEALDPSQHKSRSPCVVAPPGGLEKIERCFLLFEIRSLYYSESESERPRRCKSLFPPVYVWWRAPALFFSRLSPIPTTTT